MTSVFSLRLGRFGLLDAEDTAILDALLSHKRTVPARSYLIREFDPLRNINVIVDGIACRARSLSDGKRVIFGYLLPGDPAALGVYVLRNLGYDILALTDCVVADIDPRRMVEITEARPRIARSLWWSSLAIEATLREWIVNLALRRSEKRLAHLLCELMIRLELVGLVKGSSYELPLTQQELGDTLAMTAIHVNRSLRELREAGLVSVKNRIVTISDIERLKKFAGFDPEYLQMGVT